ncbi:hypothetical protein LTR37_008149 [Vermiconidia calcicola]|uniref:Uncharacterized protein n=1 Tax=Vermiconidia calcicola TaxID=1690605 RepID=A0ACC3NBF5_9PEZI|nr:hypothetical protein LTR37_008149 [Vermiconidia calcicola]
MLSKFSRAQPWSPSGHICRTCRLKLQQQSAHRRRFYSTQQLDDDWALNFNDLSTDVTLKKQDNGVQVSKVETSRKDNGKADNKAQTRRQRMHVAKVFDFGSLKSDLSARIGGVGDAGKVNDEVPSSRTGLVDLKANNSATTSPAKKRNQPNKRIRAERRLARARESDEQQRPPTEQHLASRTGQPAEESQVDAVIRELQKEFNEKFFGGGSVIHKRENKNVDEASIPQEPVLEFQSLVSKLSDSQPAEESSNALEAVEAESARQPPAKPVGMPRFVSSSSHEVFPLLRRPVTAASKELPNLARMVAEAESRPKWGGIPISSVAKSSKHGTTPVDSVDVRTPANDAAAAAPPPPLPPPSKKSLATSKSNAGDTSFLDSVSANFADSPADLAEARIASGKPAEQVPRTGSENKHAALQQKGGSGLDDLRRDLSKDLGDGKVAPEASREVAATRVAERGQGVNDSEANTPSSTRARPLVRVHAYDTPLIRRFGSDGIEPYVSTTSIRAPSDSPVGGTSSTAAESRSTTTPGLVDSPPNAESLVDGEAEEPNLAIESLAKLHGLHSNESKLGPAAESVEFEAKETSKAPKSAPKSTPRKEKIPKPAEKEKKKSLQTPKTARELRRMKRTIKAKGEAGASQQKSAAGRDSKRSRAATTKTADGSKTKGTSRASKEQLVAAPLDMKAPNVASIEASGLSIAPLDIPQPPVPGLQYGLDRVLFNPGVYQLQDPHSRVYNFDPYLQKIMPVVEFDYNALKEYKTSSQDTALATLAKEKGKRYIGSTSSMTSTLGHFHYLLSNFRPINLQMLSRGFPDSLDTFTNINRAPNAIFLRWKNGTYAIDADKEYDGANVLMMLGKSMEKLLTLPTSDFERYRKSDPRAVTHEERTSPESYEYTTMGDFLMRSQLDAYDPRLPGTGTFDLKTRAVISVRMNADDFQPMTGYEIHTLQGRFESYEREYYDMMRSTMLKYMLQVRMGRMDGIFVAYHNVERIFGFQYISLQEMDRALHGQVHRCLGDQEFKVSLEMLQQVFDKATEKFPEQSLRFHFEAVQESLGSEASPTTVMWVYAEPMGESEIDRIQDSSKGKVAEFERTMMGMEKEQHAASDASAAVEGESTAATGNEDAAVEAAAETNTDSDDLAYSSTNNEQPSTPAESAANLSSTASSADKAWIKAKAESSHTNLAPLFVASLICQSKVNRAACTRPEQLKPDDKWEVEYVLEEWEATERMWARYVAMKARRRDMFQKYRKEEGKEEERKEDGYITLLKSMSRQGREFRGRIDELEAGREPVVVGQCLSGLNAEVGEDVGSVEEYMRWMYGKKGE